MKNGKNRREFSIGGKLTVNRLGYGTKQITSKGLHDEPTDREQALSVLKRAVKLGVNFINIADGHSLNIAEELVVEALYPYRLDFVIGIKGGTLKSGTDEWPVDINPRQLNKALKDSLNRLKIGSIDLYQLHAVNPENAKETFEFLRNAQIEKKIKHIGLSEVTIDQIKQAQEYFEVASVQNEYSVDNRKWEDVLQYTKEQHIAFIPSSPLNQGDVKSIEVLQRIADKHQVKPEQIALSWLLQHSNNILLIPGTSQIEHLEENLDVTSIELNGDDLYELDSIYSIADVAVQG